MSATATGRDVARLAIPAAATLVAEPLFLLADSAIVGHLGTAHLAGLGVASAVLLTAAGIFVFLAYGTTALVSRAIGAGHPERALAAGLDGIWLSLAIGLVTALAVLLFATPLCSAFGASPAVVSSAATYLRISALGLPAMLALLAATGVLRGFQDTRTPLYVAVVGFAANVALNYLLVYPAGLGIAGSAWGTVLAQSGMAGALLFVVIRQARAMEVRLHPHPGRVLRAAVFGAPLLVRTLALRAAILLTAWAAAALGSAPLAAHQVTMTVYGLTGLALDAIAIAAQALTGASLGAGDVGGTRRLTRLMVWWGIGCGVVLGAALAAVSSLAPGLFSPNPNVQRALASGLLVLALLQPVIAIVCVLDGVLIGAGDGRALAVLQVATLAIYAPVVVVLHDHAAGLRSHGGPYAVGVLWWSFGFFMLARAVLLGWRARSDGWLKVGL